jgi:protein transport protein SEC20
MCLYFVLTLGLNRARASFRKAQLAAKRGADAAKRQERELLFANRSKDADGPLPARRKGLEKLTEEELALNASSDVTAALRRTHALLQSNVEQSQFAQQTLEESTTALASLSESYAGLDSLLKSSGGLVRQLIRSNKSDTWYLTTAFYIMAVTIAWLVFRRILYGPLWWLVWQPLKLLWWIAMTTLSGVGIVGRQKSVGVSSAVVGGSGTVPTASGMRPTWAAGGPAAYVPVGAKGGGWGIQRPQESPPADRKKEEKSLVDEIGDMVEGKHAEKNQEETVLKQRAPDDPPNPKKRMYERETEHAPQRDEL